MTSETLKLHRIIKELLKHFAIRNQHHQEVQTSLEDPSFAKTVYLLGECLF